ncbi:MAG: LysR family transcriptional regulator [Chloroflexi bacterium]|nr:LysR family transcriptional regulator [Chloroflexota bacterium]
MDLGQLRAFAQTARLGSFSAAARSLGLTQPGVSRQLQQLERELGCALVDREQRPVALTPEGREFLYCAENVLNELDTTLRRLKAGNDELAGPLFVVASTIPGEFIVPGLLAQFTVRHQHVKPSLLITDSAGVARELLARKAEIGFLGAPVGRRRLRLISFAEDEIVLAVPAGHPLADKRKISLCDLAGQPLVEREGGSGTLESLRRLLMQQGQRLPEYRVAMVVGTSQAQLAAIEAGVGLGFVSSLALTNRSNLKATAVEIEGVKLTRTLYLAHEHAPLSAVAQTFVRFVESRGFLPKGVPSR